MKWNFHLQHEEAFAIVEIDVEKNKKIKQMDDEIYALHNQIEDLKINLLRKMSSLKKSQLGST